MVEDDPKVRKTIYSVVVKRLLDIILSVIAIFFLSPVFVIISILELVYHGRPILFYQDRPGKNEKIFKLYKFRSMTNEVDEEGNLLPNELRITKFGRIIRRYSLDELPELFCILSGKMSFIGPRPLLPSYLPLYTKRHRARHLVRPGLAVVSLKPTKSWTWNEQFDNDIWYIENVSFLVDIKMVIAVIKVALAGGESRIIGKRDEFTSDYWKKGYN